MAAAEQLATILFASDGVLLQLHVYMQAAPPHVP